MKNVAIRYLRPAEFWACFAGLWLVLLVAMAQLDGLPRVVVCGGLTVGWLCLMVERFRNWQAHRRR